MIKHKQEQIKWTVVADSTTELGTEEDRGSLGVTNFNVHDYATSVVIGQLFLHIAFPDWWLKVHKLNRGVDAFNMGKASQQKIWLFTSEEEFLIRLGMLIGASEYGVKGKELWVVNGDRKEDGEDGWLSLVPHPHFDHFMKCYRFKDFRHFLPDIFVDEQLKDEDDPWWKFVGAVAEFNQHRWDIVKASSWKMSDESMSAYHP